MTTIRDQAYDLSPPWLRADVGATILRSVGTVLDALCDRTNEGVKLRFPEVASPTALGYIGHDRQIERPPGQLDAGYAAQLRVAFTTWRNAGGGRTILKQARLWFVNRTIPTMRLVAEGHGGFAVWHEIDTGTGVWSRIKVADNWSWTGGDGAMDRHRGWCIIQGAGIWTLDYWGDPGDWGDGGVWGSDMNAEDAVGLNFILKKWKPEHALGQIILTFDNTLFERTDALADNVDGTGEDLSWRAPLLANFFAPQGD